MTLDDLLAPERLVDLTQPLGPQTTLWPGSRPYRATTNSTIAADGYYIRDLDIPEHAGTHLDAPSHFIDGGAHVADLRVERLVRPAVVVDVADHVQDDASFVVGADLLRAAEDHDGVIAAGSVVLIRTGWDRFVADSARYLGSPGPACPGIGVDAARLLVARGVVGVGIDSLGIDPGHLADCPAHHITLGAGLWHLEGLIGLERLPARGAWVIAGVIALVDGSGAPARVMAVLPPDEDGRRGGRVMDTSR